MKGSTTDTPERSTTFGYDSIGRRVSVTDPLDATTSFTFDGAGNMASLADPLGNQTTWLYDHAGRVVEEENELEQSRTFAYTTDDGDGPGLADSGRDLVYAAAAGAFSASYWSGER